MRSAIIITALVGACVLAPALAANEQQNKMAVCNKEAAGMKGDERKAFMKECLSKKPEAPPPAANSQQSKMATCNKEAAGKKGDERKQFMSECLKAK